MVKCLLGQGFFVVGASLARLSLANEIPNEPSEALFHYLLVVEGLSALKRLLRYMFLHLRFHGVLVGFLPLSEGTFHDGALVFLVDEFLSLALLESSSPRRVGLTNEAGILGLFGINCDLLDVLVVDCSFQDLLEALSQLDFPLGSFNLDAGQ